MTYNKKKIAQELFDTAQGISYYGNALYVARDIPGITDIEKDFLEKCLIKGVITFEDRIELQNLSIKIRSMSKSTTTYLK